MSSSPLPKKKKKKIFSWIFSLSRLDLYGICIVFVLYCTYKLIPTVSLLLKAKKKKKNCPNRIQHFLKFACFADSTKTTQGPSLQLTTLYPNVARLRYVFSALGLHKHAVRANAAPRRK